MMMASEIDLLEQQQKGRASERIFEQYDTLMELANGVDPNESEYAQQADVLRGVLMKRLKQAQLAEVQRMAQAIHASGPKQQHSEYPVYIEWGDKRVYCASVGVAMQMLPGASDD